jgi:hypothetical protein
METKPWKTEIFRQQEAVDKLREFYPDAPASPGARYDFDFGICSEANGWLQYDTHQDAWYFGVWVNRQHRLTLTYAEGDINLTVSPDDCAFARELKEMADFYGEAPPAFTAFDMEPGTTNVTQITHYVDNRARDLDLTKS